MTREEVQRLSDEELRIKVAELCGWRGGERGEWTDPEGEHQQALYPTGGAFGKLFGHSKYDREVPDDYPHDLNAMHEAEKLLDGNERGMEASRAMLYKGTLANICGDPCPIHATAAQRAKAFVLTMAKLEEVK